MRIPVLKLRPQTLRNIEVFGILCIFAEILIGGFIYLTPPDPRTRMIQLPPGCTEAIVYEKPPSAEAPTCK